MCHGGNEFMCHILIMNNYLMLCSADSYRRVPQENLGRLLDVLLGVALGIARWLAPANIGKHTYVV